ncbi:MAG TPA: AI-2E family transporter [Actinomycetota bacterium]|nr:AI-2E family transporter [Actinomycetota bacterium]
MAKPGDTSADSSEGLRNAGVIAWSLLGILLLGAALLLFLDYLKPIFPPLVLALIIIFLLNPIVTRLENRGVPRLAATVVLYLVFLGLVILLISAMVPAMGSQLRELGARLPDLRADAVRAINKVMNATGLSTSNVKVEDVVAQTERHLMSGLGQITRITVGALQVLVVFIVGPVVALYLLVDLPKISTAVVGLLPPRYKSELMGLSQQCGDAIGGFFRGQLLVALIVGVLSSVALAVVGLRFWLPIGLLAGFFNLIPLVGPFVGGGVAVVVGASTSGPKTALLAAIAMVIVQQLDNHLISPKVMGRAVSVHPVVVVVALLAGGTLAGLWGMLLAVPSVAVGKIIGGHYYRTRILERVVPDGAPDGAKV